MAAQGIMATVLSGSVWFCGPYVMMGGGRLSSSEVTMVIYTYEHYFVVNVTNCINKTQKTKAMGC
jgi:hypothetical protein